QPPQIIDAFAPALPISEVADIRRSWRCPPMAAVIAGIDRVPGASKGLGEPPASAGVLGETMGDLDHRVRVGLGQPAIDEGRFAIRRGERKGRAACRVMSHGETPRRAGCDAAELRAPELTSQPTFTLALRPR